MLNSFATLLHVRNLILEMVYPLMKDNLHQEFPRIDIMVPIPDVHCILITAMRVLYPELVDCVLHMMQWHFVYFVLVEGRDVKGTVYLSLPPRIATCVKRSTNIIVSFIYRYQ